MKHIMLDLETLGSGSNAVILSIGAVAFDLKNGKILDKFYNRLDIDDQLNGGAKVSGSTIIWWFNQDDESRLKLTHGIPYLLSESLKNFSSWYNEVKGNYIWGNGVRFDVGILTDAYNRINLDIPWNFRKELDYRTFKALYPEYFQLEFKGVRHDPISDCEHQIDCLYGLFKDLKLTGW